MSSTTFNQFQAKIQDAKKRIKENGQNFIDAVSTVTTVDAEELEKLVAVDTEELKKLETEMGEKLKAEFSESVGGEETEEETEEGDSAQVENTD